MREGWARFVIFGLYVAVSVTVRDRARLLLLTNRKSYTGSRLAPNSMILHDLECQNRGFYGLF